MKFAVLADIHGNAFALQAVLADMRRFGVERAVNLGDHFSGPIDPAGTAALLAPLDFPSIRGNHDRWLIESPPDAMGPSDRVALDALGPTDLDWLKQLPTVQSAFDDVFLCHGTPQSDVTYWLERVNPDGTVRPASRSEVAQGAIGVDANVILCGHTHIPRVVRLDDGRMIVNPGSVGCPGYDDDQPVYHRVQTGTPNASYAVIEGAGKDRHVTFRSIPYDSDGASRLALFHGRPDWARALATGWFDES